MCKLYKQDSNIVETSCQVLLLFPQQYLSLRFIACASISFVTSGCHNSGGLLRSYPIYSLDFLRKLIIQYKVYCFKKYQKRNTFVSRYSLSISSDLLYNYTLCVYKYYITGFTHSIFLVSTSYSFFKLIVTIC